jgi:hypothetical protein
MEQAAQRMDPLILGGQPSPTDAAPAPNRRSCSGPECSRRSDSPAIPIVVPSTMSDPWACLDARCPPSEITRADLATEAQTVHPVSIATSIFHPPRIHHGHRIY